ncbi:YaaL family protein [Bacillus dakarensis]|uniref:YaaL family protein n=1 Tax=Robertmurraya dakarensis TaxID=1926278 RepID=UPI00098235FD|nr:YaaL family protein [Bacillus dakarensis]
MIFRRKGWLRKEFDEKLLYDLEEIRSKWSMQKALVEKSFDPSEEIIYETKLTEAKYFYLIKEAKHRKVKMQK